MGKGYTNLDEDLGAKLCRRGAALRTLMLRLKRTSGYSLVSHSNAYMKLTSRPDRSAMHVTGVFAIKLV